MSEKISTRVAYGEALAQMGSDPKIVVLDADLQCCTMTDKFGALYPERSFNVGIAEANMVGMAAGLASTGKTVFVNTFAMFAAGRAYDQIRNSLAYTNLNVKVIGTHAGITVGSASRTSPSCGLSPIWWSSPPATPPRPRKPPGPWPPTRVPATCGWAAWRWSSV